MNKKINDSSYDCIICYGNKNKNSREYSYVSIKFFYNHRRKFVKYLKKYNLYTDINCDNILSFFGYNNAQIHMNTHKNIILRIEDPILSQYYCNFLNLNYSNKFTKDSTLFRMLYSDN